MLCDRPSTTSCERLSQLTTCALFWQTVLIKLSLRIKPSVRTVCKYWIKISVTYYCAIVGLKSLQSLKCQNVKHMKRINMCNTRDGSQKCSLYQWAYTMSFDYMCCLTWTSLLIATSNFLSVPWAWLPPKKGTGTHSLSLLASSTTCFGTTSPRAPELPLAIHRTLSEEAVSCLTPLALTLQTPIRGPVTPPECAALFHLNRTRNRNSSWTTHSTRHPLQSKRHRVIRRNWRIF